MLWDTSILLWTYAAARTWHLDHLDPVATQERVLMRLLQRASTTRFGRDHGFQSIRSVQDYRSAVPARTYERFWSEYWSAEFPVLSDISWPGLIPFFAETSGTTSGRSKHIPVSSDMINANTGGAADVIVHHCANHPGTRVFGGKIFMLGGSVKLKDLAPGVKSGDLSGIESYALPWWYRPWHYPPPQIEEIENWEDKVVAIAKSILDQDIRVITGVPSWLLVLFDRIAQHSPEKPRELRGYFPNLEVIVHGGINFSLYRRAFEPWLANSNISTREAYAASEGFIAVADRGDAEGLRLCLDGGIFFEFVPVEELSKENPTRHWMANTQVGIDYALLLTSCAGLWSYILGDTIRFLSLSPPRIVITGRTSQMLSAFGEHVLVHEIEEAVTSAAGEIGAQVVDFAVGSCVDASGATQGYHEVIVEFDKHVPEPHKMTKFASELDRQLRGLNADYEAHRTAQHGLGAPRVLATAPGTFYQWLKSRNRLGGQNKVPRILTSSKALEELKTFAASISVHGVPSWHS